MNWLIVAYSMYAASLIICLRMFQRNSDIHEKLPEKMPVHYGFSGRPDRWVKKGVFTKLFSPVMGMFIVVSMFLSFHSLPAMTDGEVWPELSAMGGFMTLAVSYLLHATNEATINIALGHDEKIWNYLKLPLVVFILSMGIVSAFFFVLPDETELVDAVLCSSVEGRTPVGEKTVFTREDEYAYLWLKWKWLNDNEVRSVWYDPDGKTYFEYNHRYNTMNKRRFRTGWSRIGIRHAGEIVRPGVWRVVVYHGGDILAEKEFEIR